MIDSELPRNADDLETASPKQPIDMYELKPNEVLTRTLEPEPMTGGRRYPTQRKESTNYICQ